MRCFTLIRFVLLLSLLASQSTLCMHQTVGILLANQEENPFSAKQVVIDPIITELAVYIDQNQTPVVASRQLVHRLIRYQKQGMADQLNPRSKLHTLCSHLNHFYHKQTVAQLPDLLRSYTTAPKAETVAIQSLDPSFSLFLSKHPALVDYFFITCVRAARCHFYRALHNGDPEPFYIITGSTLPLEEAREDAQVSLIKTTYEDVAAQAFGETTDQQKKDYPPISGEKVCWLLHALQNQLPLAQKERSLIVALSGHGVYTRSTFGMISDQLQPSAITSLPTKDECSRETKHVPGVIAGLTVPEFSRFISLLPQYATTSLLYYSSCYTGNQHLILPYLHNENAPLLLPYTMVSRCIDSQLSYCNHVSIQISSDNQLAMVCPIDPKTFFKEAITWCTQANDMRNNKELLRACFAMISSKKSRNVALRSPLAPSFKPLLASGNVCLSKSILQANPELEIKQPRAHIFLGHNLISQPLTVTIPLIRSCIPTNCTFYIHELTCIDPKNRSLLEVLANTFFHRYNCEAVNRIIFFIKTLKIESQGASQLLHDVLLVQQTIWEKNKNELILWRNEKPLTSKQSYSITYSKLETFKEIDPLKAFVTYLHYLKLATQEQSYIEAPALCTAAPDAFDDTAIKEYCADALLKKECTSATIKKLWQMLGFTHRLARNSN